MADKTGIQWTDATINPIAAFDRATGKRGWFCVHASTGCLNCYAEQTNGWRGNGHRYRLPNAAKVELHIVESVLAQPLSWRAPRKIFVCLMTDLFLEQHTDAMIDRVFAMMAMCQQQQRGHVFQVLTKRAERMRDYCNARLLGLPLANVWLGVSVENQKAADERIPLLLETPAAVRFLSCEPLLGPIDILESIRVLHRRVGDFAHPFDRAGGIDWVIVGGESGRAARPMNIDWISQLVAQCDSHQVPAFVKQLGARPYSDTFMISFKGNTPRLPVDGYRLLSDSHGGDMAEWPEHLRIRKFPRVAVPA